MVTEKQKLPKASVIKFPRLPTEKVREGLEKSGMPLELQTKAALRADGWAVKSHEPYEDTLRGKKVNRTIDIVATKLCETKSQLFSSVKLVLVVECKQQADSAWVFERGSRPKRDWAVPAQAAFYCDDSSLPQCPESIRGSVAAIVGRLSHQNREMDPWIGLSGMTYKPTKESRRRKKEGPDLLHKGSLQVLKATECQCQGLSGRRKPTAKPTGIFPLVLWRVYSALVFRGSLFLAFLNHNRFELEEDEYVVYELKMADRKHLVDVVRSDSLPKYLRLVDSEFQGICDTIDTMPQTRKRQKTGT